MENESNVKSFLNNVFAGNNVKARNSFNNLMQNTTTQKIEDRKKELANAVVALPAEQEPEVVAESQEPVAVEEPEIENTAPEQE
jgi:hypothetical protein